MVITPDTPIEESLFEEGESDLFCLNVTARDRFEVILKGPLTGADFDLYAKIGAPPSLSEYDARGYSPTSQERLELFVQSSGVLFISVRSHSGHGDYSLQVNVTTSSSDCLALESGVTQAGTLTGPDEGVLYCLDVENGDQAMVALDGPQSNADFDVYLKLGSPPTLEDYDARGFTPFADETVSLGDLEAGRLYVWVVSFIGSGDYTVMAEITDAEPCTPLTAGESQVYTLTFPNDEKLYCIEVDETDQISVTLDGPDSEADFDLYLRFGTPPTLADYDVAATTPSSDESISSFVALSQGTVYVRVWSYYGRGEFSIQVNRVVASALRKTSSDPNKVLFVKGQIAEKLTAESVEPDNFCIVVKDLDKFCYNSDPAATSEITFIPGGYFFFIMNRLVGDYTLTLTDVSCYLDTSPETYTEQELSSVLFEVEIDPAEDCDHDGMENEWEKQNSLNMWKDDAALDLDSDGYTNLQEYNGSSDPDDGDSIPEGSKFVELGDVSGDNQVDLVDAIIGCQAACGGDVSKVLRPNYSTSGVDVNGDGKLGIAEVIYVMQKVSESR
jgi:hypothetical protein